MRLQVYEENDSELTVISHRGPRPPQRLRGHTRRDQCTEPGRPVLRRTSGAGGHRRLAPVGGSNGGTTVTITGTDLHDIGTTDVLFGSVAAASVTAVSPTEITAVSPSEATGLRNIFVTTPNGTSASDTGDQFDYS